MFKYHRQCRSCGSKELIPVFSLGLQPLANSFRTADEEQDGFVPLNVLFCPQCTLAQLSVVVNPKILYENYPYVTSPTETMQRHFEMIYRDIAAEVGQEIRVLEIGSNDGTMLRKFKELGAAHIEGIEPAENLAEIAMGRGVFTIPKLFNTETVKECGHLIAKSNVIIARHVFCHVDDWHDFIAALEMISTKETLVCLEVPYVQDTISNLEFDTIYHEHLSYLSILSMLALLKGAPWVMHKILRYPIHGGSIIMMLRRVDFNFTRTSSSQVLKFLGSEKITVETWHKFSNVANGRICRLHGMIEGLVLREGKTVAGLGASAKSTVWINASGIAKWISFIADETPQKQGRFSPGTQIPIVPESEIFDKQPDYVILFAWNWKDECMKKHAEYLKRGGKFIIPVPDIQIVP